MITVRYTLEYHLEEHCRQDQSFNMLLYSYQYNKRQICEVLDHVIMHFPHFSKHGASHSACIIASIELLLGEERIRRLSASDTYFILLAAYLHDIGMYLTNEQIRTVWMTEEFHDYLNTSAASDESAKFVKQFYDGYDPNDPKRNEQLAELVEHLRNVHAEYFRRPHGENGAKRIRSNLRELDIFLDAGQHVPKRLIRLLSKICSAHNDNFSDLMAQLPHKQSSSLGDLLHPRFIAVMLRLGDLLDMDNNRFDELAVKAAIKDLHPVSQIHYDKHNAVEELLITPELIQTVSISEDVQVLLESKQWMDWIKGELDNFRDNWHQIVPDGMPGSVPKFEFSVKRSNSERSFEDKDLKLALPPEKAFDIIIGSHIYKDRFIFLRELIQNSLDALKRQLWRDVSRSALAAPDRNKYEAPYQLSEQELEAYRVRLYFYDTSKSVNGIKQLEARIGSKLMNTMLKRGKQSGPEIGQESHLFVVIEDNGTGISLAEFEHRILQAGKKTEKQDAYRDEVKSMPPWLQPTGTFGIGLHSVFQVASEVVIQTRSELDPISGREIYIQSGRHGGYVSSDTWDAEKNHGCGMPIRRGTRIILRLDSHQELLLDSHTPILSLESFKSQSTNVVMQYMESVTQRVLDGIQYKRDHEQGELSDGEEYGEVPVYTHHNKLAPAYITYQKFDSVELGDYYVEFAVHAGSSNIVSDRSNLVIFVYDKQRHHRLWLTPSHVIEKEPAARSAVSISYKSIRVEDDVLAEKLSRLLFFKDKLRVDFDFSQTRDYLHLNRDGFLLPKHEELVGIVDQMLQVALEGFQNDITRRYTAKSAPFPDMAVFKSYNALNRMLFDRLGASCAALEQQGSISLGEGLKLFKEQLNEHSGKLTQLLREHAGLTSEMIQIVGIKRLYSWLHVLKRRFSLELQHSDEHVIAVRSFFEEALGVINGCWHEATDWSHELDKYINRLHYLCGGSSLYIWGLPIMERSNAWLKDYKLFLQSTYALKMMLYHIRFGQLPSLSEEYKHVLAVLSDHYIEDDQYGHYSNPEENETSTPLLYIRDNHQMRRVYFGSEAVLYPQHLYFRFDEKNEPLISFKPVQRLSIIGDRRGQYYHYEVMEAKEETEPVCIQLTDERTEEYLFSELLHYDYVDIEQMDWLSFSYEYYVLPAFSPFERLAVALHWASDAEGINQQRELRLIYQHSRFRFIRQGCYVVVPFTRKQMEKLIARLGGLSYQLHQVADSAEQNQVRESIRVFLKTGSNQRQPLPPEARIHLEKLLWEVEEMFASETFKNMADFNTKYVVSGPREAHYITEQMKQLAWGIVAYMFKRIG